MATDPTSMVLAAAGGDFFLIIFGLLFLFVLGLCAYLVYQMPKEWEKSTDRIVSKICEVVGKQDKILLKQESLESQYKEHDFQAKKIWDNLETRPCVNGKKRD
jgi:hypothetical protein